jgi:hypothetical protein
MHQATNKRGGSHLKEPASFIPPPLPFLSCLAESTESDIVKANQARCKLLRYVVRLHQRIVPSPSIIGVPPLT